MTPCNGDVAGVAGGAVFGLLTWLVGDQGWLQAVVLGGVWAGAGMAASRLLGSSRRSR